MSRCTFRPTCLFLILLCAHIQLAAQCDLVVDAGDDVYLCLPPTPTQLQGSVQGVLLNFSWSPTTGMTGANTLSPTVAPTVTTNYVLTARGYNLNDNLIINGNFEDGNVGFTSDYVESPGNLVPEGVYEVLTNPQNSHPSFAPCADHTSGTGNMMAVNGAGTPGLNVWCQTVNVDPNTAYVFSAWVTTLVSASPALLQFSINGSTIGPVFSAPSATCVWANFFSTWNSGGASSADICILNQNTTLGGNDFALDDLVFSPVCEKTDTVTVHVVPVVAVANPPVSVIPCEGSPIPLNGTGSSTGSNVTYQWETINGNIVSGETTLNPIVDAPGAYTLTVSIENAGVICERSVTVNVTPSPAPLAAWIIPPQPIGCGGSSSLVIGNTSQPTFATYQWTTDDGNILGPDTTRIISVNTPGTYTLLVTNTQTGCTATAEVTVGTANNPPIAIADTQDSINCISSEAVLSGNGSSTGPNIQYQWSTLNGVLLSGQQDLNALAGAPGVYVLAVSNTSNNCVTTDTVQVFGDITPASVSIQAPDTLNCRRDTLTLRASVDPPGAAFSWNTVFGNFLSGNNSLSPVVNASGYYILEAIHPTTGCIGVDTVWVPTDTLAPVAVAGAIDTLTCSTPQVVVSATGSSSGPHIQYLWTTLAGNIIGADTASTALVNAPAWYTLQVFNPLNGCLASDSVLIAADTNAITASANVPGPITCLDTVLTLNTTGSTNLPGLVFQWTTTSGNILSGAQTPNPVVNAPGAYALLATNPANGCSATDTTFVAVDNTPPEVLIPGAGTLTCARLSVSLSAQTGQPGTYVYLWNTDTGQFDSPIDGPTVSANAPGLYTVEVLNTANGCLASDTIVVGQNTAPPVIQAEPGGVLTCTATALSLSASAQPGAVPTWVALSGGNILSGTDQLNPVVDQPGLYVLSATDTLNGCTATDTTLVGQNTTPPLVVAGADDTLSCALSAITLSVDAPGAVLSWTATAGGQILSGGTTSNPLVNAPGMYTVTGTNPVNGCTAVDTTIVVADNDAPFAQISDVPTLTCRNTTATIVGTGSSGPGILYQWSTQNGLILSGDQTLAPEVGAAGTYTLTVLNTGNGCTDSAYALVSIDTVSPIVSVGQPDTLTCSRAVVQLQGATQSGQAVWNWSTADGQIISGAQTPTPQVDRPGMYTLTVENLQNGCTAQRSIAVPIDTVQPVLLTGAPDRLTCLVQSVTLSANVLQADAFLATWNTANGNIVSGQNTLNPTTNAPGLYTLSVQNTVNGCERTASVAVVQDIQPPDAQAGPADTLTCAFTQRTLDGSASDGAGSGLTYTWTALSGGQIASGASGPFPVVVAPGAYILMVTRTDNGCSDTDTTQVARFTDPPSVALGMPAVIDCSRDTVPLSASAVPANSQVQWSTPNGVIGGYAGPLNPFVLAAGTYTVLVTRNDNGCTAQASTTVVEDRQPPLVTMGPDQILYCKEPVASISASATPPGSQFQWSTTDGNILSGSGAGLARADAAGAYTVVVSRTDNGCTASGTLFVESIPAPAFLPRVVQPNCNMPTGSIAFESVSGGMAPFRYSIRDGQNSQDSPFFGNLGPGAYGLVLSDDLGCSATAQVQILPPVVPEITLDARLTLSLGASVTLVPQTNLGPPTALQWQWSPPEGLSCTNCPTPLASPTRPTQYAVTVTDPDGCSASASILILVNRARNLYAPNIFSPGSSGLNDRFVVYGKAVEVIESLQVFDRWGNLVFQTQDIPIGEEAQGWDGTHRGQPLNPGVFVWMAKIRFIDGESEVFSGDVTLLR